MVAEGWLEQLETTISEQPTPRQEVGTHWTGCWVEHPACAVAVVSELVHHLRAAGARQVTLDRIIFGFMTGDKAVDQPMRMELERIKKVWYGAEQR